MSQNSVEVTPPAPKAFSVAVAAQMLGIGRSTAYREMNEGRLASIKRRKRRLVTADALDAWLTDAAAA